MLLRRLFKVRPAVEAGRKLYAAAVAQARQPRFYTDFAAPDTREGRFDLYTLHVVLLVRRLKGEGEQAAETSQALFDAYLRGLDDAFRELGASDLSVAKKMKKLGQAFYGRARAYEEAFAALPDTAALTRLIWRILYDDEGAAPAAGLADYAGRAVAGLGEAPLEALLQGEVHWPEISA